MPKVLVISHDPVGATMSGPGIRYYHFAEELGNEFEVTLAAPGPERAEVPGVETVTLRDETWSSRMRQFADYDVLVTRPLPLDALRPLARNSIRLVFDLYVPILSEQLAALAIQPEHEASDLFHRMAMLDVQAALVSGDAFVCASERQRDFWLGMLGTLGRLDPGAYRVEPSFRTLIDVAPFGISDDSPRPTARIVKGIRPGISGDDRLLLWGGGVWNWLDPLTPIRAVAELARGRDDVKLLFLALRHPDVILHRRAKEAVALARSLDVLDRHVFFNEQWVPYADRQAFLLEADLGISAHFDTLETRYAYRARLLDYFWAGLPTVTTRGDVLADLVVQRGLGEAVPPQDVDAWAAALVRLLDDPEARSAVRTRLSELRPELSWASAVKPLARIVHAQLETARGAHPWSRSLQSRNLALRLAAAYRIRGAAGLLKRQAKKVAARSRA